MRHLFIINPAAGKKETTAQLEAKLATLSFPYEVRYTLEAGDAQRITEEAAAQGEPIRIYACGGDGTLNEVVNGAAGYGNVAVTMFAAGSGNDFAKMFNETEPFRDLERLLDCEEATFDLIRCNDDFSLNICSVGLDARIGTDVSNYKRLPLLHGFRAYVASTLVNVIRGIHEHYVVEVNGERIDGNQTLICACNGRYYGGGFNPVPEAEPDDGLLEVLVVKKVSRLQVAAVIGKYKNGQYNELPHLIRHIRTKSLKIICDKETPVNLDGELRMAQTVDIRLAEEKIRFFYPKGLVWSKKVTAGV